MPQNIILLCNLHQPPPMTTYRLFAHCWTAISNQLLQHRPCYHPTRTAATAVLPACIQQRLQQLVQARQGLQLDTAEPQTTERCHGQQGSLNVISPEGYDACEAQCGEMRAVLSEGV